MEELPLFTVLLADDENTVLETLKSRVPWQELGVETLLTAADGQSALELVKAHTVSLLVADIRMPVMDGLTLIRHVRRISPDTHCIVLSAYDEFEYAREAISLGVENYLLKPLEMDELEQTVKRALENIYANRSEQWLTYANTLLRWATGSISIEELADRATHLGVNLYLPEYLTACVQRRDGVSLAAFLESCLKDFTPQYALYHCRDDQGHSLMIFGGRSLDRAAIASRLETLAQRSGVSDRVRIALGSPVHEASELAKSYLSAMNSLEMNAASVSVLPQETDGPGVGSPFCDDILLLLHASCESAALEEIRQYVRALSCEDAAQTLLFFMKACTRALLAEYPLGAPSLQDSVFSHQAALEGLRKREGIRTALTQLFGEAFRASQQYFDSLDPTVRLAIRYIRSAYASGVSIRDFCSQRSINPAYLGHLFKCECGVFFNEYLARVRITHASVLLRDPALRVYDVATQTGFSSPSYFVKSFKSLTGVSPAKFRLEQYHLFISDVSDEE